MNTTAPRNAPMAAEIRPARLLYWSVRRELWEYRSLYVAPLAIAALIVLGFTVGLGDLPARLQAATTPGALQQRELVEQPYTFAALLLMLTTILIGVFYSLDTLYGERRDRSVLFWKSLPLSDRDTVLSKAASALVVAPVIATGAAIATMFAFGLVVTLVMPMHGLNPFKFYWGMGNPIEVAGTLVAAIPVYAMWALPTVGWLMLCSAWARSKPFLWAVMIPVFAGIFVAWFDVMNIFNLDTGWFWQHIVLRALTSVFPGMWMTAQNLHIENPENFDALSHIQSMYSVFATPQMWIGAVVGIAMIVAAIRLRRWRDDN